MDCGFDVASTVEMEMVKSINVSPKKIIYANPVKDIDHILSAKKHGINLMTFDTSEELFKIKKYYPDAEVVLRIAVMKTTALWNLSLKFGAIYDEIPGIFQSANKLNLKIRGLAFHTGSGGVTYDSYKETL